jgi:anti-sigma factor RsiW
VTAHLTDEQLARYVARKGDADEILAVAQHLEDCWECRDRTAAMVDDGASDRPHHHSAEARARGGEVKPEGPLRRLLRWLRGD